MRVGSTVRWTNDDGVYHTVTSTAALDRRRPSGLFDGVLAGRGATFEYTFARAGTYHFYCQPHSDHMVGTVRVIE